MTVSMTLGLLLLRVVVGLTLAAHGSQKLFGAFGGGGIAGTGAFFEKELRFKPGRTYATMAGVTEFAAGLALALGFFTPVASAGVIGIMVVAGVAGHRQAGFFIARGGYEYTVILATAAATLAFVGPGAASVDGMLGWDLHGTMWGVMAILIGGVLGLFVLAGRGRVDEDDVDAVVEDFVGEEAVSRDEAVSREEAEVAGGREAGIERSPSREQAQR